MMDILQDTPFFVKRNFFSLFLYHECLVYVYMFICHYDSMLIAFIVMFPTIVVEYV